MVYRDNTVTDLRTGGSSKARSINIRTAGIPVVPYSPYTDRDTNDGKQAPSECCSYGVEEGSREIRKETLDDGGVSLDGQGQCCSGED